MGRMLGFFAHLLERLSERYRRLLGWSLGHRKSVLGIAAASLVGAFALTAFIGSEFVPEADLDELQVQFLTPEGSSLELTESKARQAEAAIREFPEVKHTYATVNTGVTLGKNAANIFVQLTPRRTRQLSQQALVPRVRERLSRIAGIEVTQVGSFKPVSSGKPLQVSILGADREVLERLSRQVMEIVRGTAGAVDVETSSKSAKPQLGLQLKRELASDLGISLGQVAGTLRPLLSGEAVGSWRGPDGQFYDVTVQLPRASRESVGDLKRVNLTSTQLDANGAPRMVPLREVVEFTPGLGATQINRKEQNREVLVSGNVSGRPTGDAANEIKAKLQAIDLPPGYRFSMGGSSKDIAESMSYAGVALVLAVIFIYLILASQFGSFLQPVAIMASLPLSLIGVLLALLLFRSTLNIFSIIGFVMLMGLVTKNAILLVDFVNQARGHGMSRTQAVVEAGAVRLRPILMTTLAMIFGMIPLALGLGDGGEQRSPMGQAVIGGVITSSLLTLIVVPVIYTYLDDFAAWARRLGTSGESLSEGNVG
jgi:hydrophobic/amphiphilic exporter-1 (mainly G- bacteria), HAE1 family